MPVGLIKVVAVPLQTTWFVMGVTVGVGLTLIKNEKAGPTHPFAVGVNVMVELMAVEPGLVAVNEGMSPLPLATKPMSVLLFVQL